jgi:hypothetical protein
MRFLSYDVQAYNGWSAHSVICRGKDPTGHWADHSRPTGEQVPVPGNPESSMNDLVNPAGVGVDSSK